MGKLHSLTLHGNPWKCDCQLRPLIDWLVDANLPMVDLPRCKSPDRLSGQRFADIAPTGLLHKTVCDTQLAGYSLPANTLVMANYNACHRSAEYWTQPDTFNPDHFLEEGKLITDKEGFLPYGIGPRVCPGAELADMQLFLMLSNILATFTLSLPEGDTGEMGTQFEAGTAVLRNPKPYRVIFRLRQ